MPQAEIAAAEPTHAAGLGALCIGSDSEIYSSDDRVGHRENEFGR